MDLPFTTDQFLGVFARYNETYFPMQIVFYLLAVWILILLIRKPPYANALINNLLAFFWIWMGTAYHWITFTSVNPAAWIFGTLFVLQGIAFAIASAKPQWVQYRVTGGWVGALGWLFVLYALIVYPALGYILGHHYPEIITIGLPCPTTIFTFGILLWTTATFRKWIAIIPFVWAIIGTSAAFKLGIWQDLGLSFAGITGALILWTRKSKTPPVTAP